MTPNRETPMPSKPVNAQGPKEGKSLGAQAMSRRPLGNMVAPLQLHTQQCHTQVSRERLLGRIDCYTWKNRLCSGRQRPCAAQTAHSTLPKHFFLSIYFEVSALRRSRRVYSGEVEMPRGRAFRDSCETLAPVLERIVSGEIEIFTRF